MREQAQTLVASGFLPKAINTPEKAIAVIMTGKELGLGPMQALRSIHVIEGKPTLSADLIAGLVHARVPGAVLRVAESTDKRCAVEAGRPNTQATMFTFTIEDAQKAALMGKDNWKKYPRAMLRARCLTEAARAVFPDAVMGLYDPDELGAVTTPEGDIDTSKLPIAGDTSVPIRASIPVVVEDVHDDPTPWFDRIAEAADMNELGIISESLKARSFSMLDREELREAWGARREDLRRGKVKQREPGEDDLEEASSG
jgi:hypothetical protein